MKEIDRREFLKFGAAACAGVATNLILTPVSLGANKATEKITGNPAGNANTSEKAEKACEDSENKEKCVNEYKFSNAEKTLFTFVTPINEEVAYRALPSLVVSEMDNRPEPFKDIVGGTWSDIGMTRRELLFGVASSVIFGALHNITDSGVDLKTIPTSQTMAGGVYWYLQRKFGVVSNTVAHVLNNFRALW